MRKERQRSGYGARLRGIGLGVLCAAVLAMALCCLGGLLLSKEAVPEQAMPYASWVICAISVFCGCLIAQKKAGGGGLPVCLACTGLILMVMGIVRSLSPGDAPKTWYCAAIAGACALAAALFGTRDGRRRR